MDQRLSPLLELKFDAGSAGRVKGYASTWGGPPDSYGDLIAMGAFTKTLKEHKAEGTMPAMLWGHDADRPIGRWTSLVEDKTGLAVEGQLNLGTTGGKDAFAHVQAGDVTGLSIGFIVPPGGKKKASDGSTLLTEIHLLEVSVVTFPANRRTRVSLGSKRELEEHLIKSGLPRAAAVRLATAGWPTLSGPSLFSQTEIKTAADRIARMAAQLRTSK